MRDLALDPATGDLAITAGRLALTEGTGARVQRLRLRLALWRGEYVFDRAKGVPYTDLLARKGAGPLLEATLRQAAATCPGIAALKAFGMTQDARARTAAVSLVARADTGEPVTLEAFEVAA